MSTTWTVTFDCARPAALAELWCLALGYVAAGLPDHVVMADPEGNEFCVL